MCATALLATTFGLLQAQAKPKTYSSHLIEPASDLRKIIEELKD